MGAGSIPHLGGKILNLNGPRSENRQWGDICPNASGDEWNSLLSATLRGKHSPLKLGVKKEQNHCTKVVPPTYGYIVLALVKCSNDGGPGPRHNMKEDPGSSIFSMLVVYGYYLHLLTSSQNQVTGRTSGDPLPPLRPAWAKHPLLPLLVPTPPPAKMKERPASEKSHFSL